MVVKIKRLFSNVVLPEYKTENSAGLDLRAYIKDNIIIKPFQRKLIATGLAIELPDNYEAQIRPRSGLALKNGITVFNSPGTIDSDYRGEIQVLLVNFGDEDFIVENNMRIAQLVISQIRKVKLIEVNELSQTKRNEGGFGSTGTK